MASKGDFPEVLHGEASTSDDPPKYSTSTSSPLDTGGTPGSSQAFRTDFACLFFYSTDKIRLLNFPESDISQIKEIVQSIWPRGIQNSKPYGIGQEIKLHGYPFKTSGSGHGLIEGRQMVGRLLQELFNMGWVLTQSVDVCMKAEEKDTLIFRHQNPVPAPRWWLCVSFAATDKIHILGGAPEFQHDVFEALAPLLSKHEQLDEKHSNAYEIKFKGNPWSAVGEATIGTRLIILKLVGILEKHGYSLYGSFSTDNGNVLAPDAWFCCRELDWKPGEPVYHS